MPRKECGEFGQPAGVEFAISGAVERPSQNAVLAQQFVDQRSHFRKLDRFRKEQAFFSIKVKADFEPEDVVNLLVPLRDLLRIGLGSAFQADAQRQRVLVLVPKAG